MDDYNPPEEARQHLDEYVVNQYFDTELERINVQALGIETSCREVKGNSMGFDHVKGLERKAAIYYPPDVEFTSVLMFNTARGFYCCQTEQDIEKVEEWFKKELDEHLEEGIQPVQF